MLASKMKPFAIFSLCVAAALFSSCTKKSEGLGTVIFYISNVGSNGPQYRTQAVLYLSQPGMIKQEIKTLNLPQNDTTVVDCNPFTPNVAVFNLKGGEYDYMVDASPQNMSGKVTVYGGECRIIELKYK